MLFQATIECAAHVETFESDGLQVIRPLRPEILNVPDETSSSADAVKDWLQYRWDWPWRLCFGALDSNGAPIPCPPSLGDLAFGEELDPMQSGVSSLRVLDSDQGHASLTIYTIAGIQFRSDGDREEVYEDVQAQLARKLFFFDHVTNDAIALDVLNVISIGTTIFEGPTFGVFPLPMDDQSN